MLKLLVDFNEVRNGYVLGLSQFAEGPRAIRPGDRVLVHDDGEEEALAFVEDVHGGLIRARVDWTSFGPAGRITRAYGVWLINVVTTTATATTPTANLMLGEPGYRPMHRLIEVSDASFFRGDDRHTVKVPA